MKTSHFDLIQETEEDLIDARFKLASEFLNLMQKGYLAPELSLNMIGKSAQINVENFERAVEIIIDGLNDPFTLFEIVSSLNSNNKPSNRQYKLLVNNAKVVAYLADRLESLLIKYKNVLN